MLVVNVDGTTIEAGGATQLDYLAYFSEDPRFRRFMSAYQVAGRVGRYTVYRRP